VKVRIQHGEAAAIHREALAKQNPPSKPPRIMSISEESPHDMDVSCGARQAEEPPR
jgi:hypothetical protein